MPDHPSTLNLSKIAALRTDPAGDPKSSNAHSRKTSATSGPHPSAVEVALTFDDLPVHGPLPAGLSRVDIIESIIHALQSAHAPPVYGFVNAKRLEEDPSAAKVLQLWRAAGFALANHTFSHMDLNANSLDAFEKDLLADEPTLRTLMGSEDWHWFRFPFLREGDTPEKHKAITTFLKEHGYKVAEVTLSFDDYAYNDPYARCLAKNDQQGIEWLKQNYLTAASDSLLQGEKLSNLVLGRQIKHTMLLHIGGFETVMLPHLLDLLKEHEIKLITLQEAESDPVYAISPDLPSDWNGTFLDELLLARHIPDPRTSNHRFAKLNALCR